jgi:DNA-binding CsgD family transcriptional regulator
MVYGKNKQRLKMKQKFGTIQKRIGILISGVDLIVVITNFIFITNRDGSVVTALTSFNVWFMFLIGIPFIISIFVESRFLKIVQISSFLLVGIFSVLDDYEDFYGPALFLAAWLLLRHYGFLEQRGKLKNGILIASIVVLSQISANINTHEGVYAGFSTLWYALFLISLILIIWRDIIKQQEELKTENTSLKTNYKKLAAQLDEIEDEKKPYNLRSMNISPAEERVIKTLTIYKASNREISERLNIAESTVKLHLYNIYNKIGVDNRFAIIDLCRYNYPEVTSFSLETD